VATVRQYSRTASITPGDWRSLRSARNGMKYRWSPGDSRSQSTVNTRRPVLARIHAMLANAIVRPTPPLYE
jgi:hypothetical protein